MGSLLRAEKAERQWAHAPVPRRVLPSAGAETRARCASTTSHSQPAPSTVARKPGGLRARTRMRPMKVTLPDGKELELADGASGADAAAAIGPGLAKAALAVKVDETTVQDLARPLHNGARIDVITDRSGQDALDLIRHDTAHVLAAAVMELYPGVKISIGPPIEHGFYYDFEFPDGVTVSDADFERIEAKMREHVAADEPFVREDVSVQEALE